MHGLFVSLRNSGSRRICQHGTDRQLLDHYMVRNINSNVHQDEETKVLRLKISSGKSLL
jgi:hypothetical protein